MLKPTPIAGLDRVKAIAASDTHACALDMDGLVTCWGDDQLGATGEAPGSDCSASCISGLTTVPAITRVEQIAIGSDHSCALLGGLVKCWGRADDLGINEPDQTAMWAPLLPVFTNEQNALSDVTEIAAFGHRTCALGGDSVWCWGFDNGFATNLPW